MKQPIAGVAPAELEEVTTMVVWPSIAAYGLGRFLGRGYAIKAPDVYIFRMGNLLALMSIPLALALYFYRLKPCFFGIPLHGSSYKLTNRRVMEVRNEIHFTKKKCCGMTMPCLRFDYQVETKAVNLDRFDTIEIVRRPGQEWFDAGDLVFRQGEVETFRLDGVSRPESFRQTCLKSRMAHVGVKKALERELAHA